MTEPAWIAEAQELRDRGLSYASVARKLGNGVNRNTVYHWLRRKHVGEPKKCQGCGKEFLANSSLRTKFCSRGCFLANHPGRSPEGKTRFIEAMRDRKGRKNPNYKHGRSEGRDRRYEQEFKIKAQEAERCRSCGATGPLHAHHAVPRSLSPSGMYDPRNCLPLCPSCHSRWHRATRIISRDVFTAEEWVFVRTLIGPTWLDKRYPVRLIVQDSRL